MTLYIVRIHICTCKEMHVHVYTMYTTCTCTLHTHVHVQLYMWCTGSYIHVHCNLTPLPLCSEKCTAEIKRPFTSEPVVFVGESDGVGNVPPIFLQTVKIHCTHNNKNNTLQNTLHTQQK